MSLLLHCVYEFEVNELKYAAHELAGQRRLWRERVNDRRTCDDVLIRHATASADLTGVASVYPIVDVSSQRQERENNSVHGRPPQRMILRSNKRNLPAEIPSNRLLQWATGIEIRLNGEVSWESESK